MTEHDARLVRALGAAHVEGAARALYREFGGELYGFAVRRLGDAGLAEEVVQDVFERAWRHAGDYDEERASVRTWLYAIARNAITDAERRRGRRPPLNHHDASEPEAGDEPIERALLRWQVQLALDRLTPEHGEVVRLAHLYGMTLGEIAERTGLPLGTVKSRAFYALKNLRLALDELGVQP